MPDFYINRVPTFTLLREDATESMEKKILRISKTMPIGVIIPALYSDLASDAMRNIIQELRKAEFVKRVYISLDKADKNEFKKGLEIVKPLEDRVVLLWNNNPSVENVVDEIESLLPLGPPGKGRAVWTALGYVLAKDEVSVVAFHDADIVTYDKNLLIRLVYPVVALRYQFSKGFYVRYANKLYGRVVRLFYFPFVRSLREVIGLSEFLEYMADFRYPLSGEFATFIDIAREIRFPSDWGIEVGILSEIYHLVTIPRICQVELTKRYDHKHQKLGKSPKTGLLRMVTDIARTFFTQLSSQGYVIDEEMFHTLKLTYLTEAREVVGVYEALARMHNLDFDLHEELTAVESFAGALDNAFEELHKYPFGSPLIPNWKRVEVAIDDVLFRLQEALEEPLKS